MQTSREQWHIFGQLVRAELVEIKKVYVGKLIDTLIYATVVVIAAGYFMPYLGISATFGAFTAATIFASPGAYEGYPFIAKMLYDFDGQELISYEFTLPVPTWMIFVKKWMVFSLYNLCTGLVLLPFGIMLVPHQFDYSKISCVKSFLILLVSTIFLGAFNLFIASAVKTSEQSDAVWTRFYCPLTFLGACQFSWESVAAKSTFLGWCVLLNPIVYVYEGSRAAVLGQAGSLPFWNCLMVLILCTILFGVWGIKRLQKQRDCVR